MTGLRIRIAVALLVAGAGVWFLVRALASDETRIRWRIEDAVDSLNAMKAGATVEVLADDFVDRTSGATRALVEAYLRRAFLLRQNRHEGAFRYPVSLDDGSLDITVGEPSEGRAHVAATARFLDVASDGEVAWVVVLDAVFDEVDGDWKLREASYETKSGRPPF